VQVHYDEGIDPSPARAFARMSAKRRRGNELIPGAENVQERQGNAWYEVTDIAKTLKIRLGLSSARGAGRLTTIAHAAHDRSGVTKPWNHSLARKLCSARWPSATRSSVESSRREQ
jgi:hypothetical protein